MEPFFQRDAGNPHSVDHAAGWAAQRAIEQSASTIADFIGADPDEIIFTSGATEANNLAILGLAERAPQNRRRILVSAIEHKCVLASASAATGRHGLALELIPAKENGLVDTDWLRANLRDDVLCVAVMAVNNEIGTIQPLGEIGKLCADVGAVFHCDAAQAPLAIRLNIHQLGIGTLSLSAHKIYGPKGIGVAFLGRDLQDHIAPLIFGGGQQRNLRSGTLPTPLCVGFGSAISILQGSEWASERERVKTLRDRFERELMRLGDFVRINVAATERHPGNLNVQFAGYSAHDILLAVQPNLAASTGSACTSGIPEPSHVLRAIGLSESEAGSSIRFSLGRFTAQADIGAAVTFLRGALSRLAAAA
jgi:cysteine desulfurase